MPGNACFRGAATARATALYHGRDCRKPIRCATSCHGPYHRLRPERLMVLDAAGHRSFVRPGTVPVGIRPLGDGASTGSMSRVAASPCVPAPTRAAVAPFVPGPVIGVGAFVTVLLIVVAGRYGYHRDALCFLACSRP
jgi:hypothetical protein